MQSSKVSQIGYNPTISTITLFITSKIRSLLSTMANHSNQQLFPMSHSRTLLLVISAKIPEVRHSTSPPATILTARIKLHLRHPISASHLTGQHVHASRICLDLVFWLVNVLVVRVSCQFIASILQLSGRHAPRLLAKSARHPSTKLLTVVVILKWKIL